MPIIPIGGVFTMSTKHEEIRDGLTKGKGFYIALSICTIAVIAAGWSTYCSIKDFSNPSEAETHNQDSLNDPETSGQSTNVNLNGTITDKNLSEKHGNNSSSTNKFSNHSDFNYDDEENHDLETKSVSNENADILIVYPTDNTVIKEFSDGKPVYSKTLGDWRIHDGTDFRAERGSIVKSATSGTVKDVYNDPSYGTTIVIEHDLGFVAYYSGLGETTLVNKEDRVKAGQDIGSIKDVPVEIAEDPHLHFMVNKEGKFIDPMLILDKESE